MIAGYIRVSSARQRDESDSPASQRQRLTDAGCTAFYEDLAVSGYKLEQRRKAASFQRLQEAIRSRQITRLIATRLDRIARRDQIVLELAELCDAHGVEFVTLGSGTVDTSTASGWLGVKMQLVIAEHFSRQLSENIRNGYQGLHAQGIAARSAQSLPFHLQREPGTRHGVIASPAWPHARHVVEQLLQGLWGPPDAARYLHAQLDTHGDPKTVVSWLKAPSLAGHCARRDGSILIRDCWPALVSDAERAQLLLALQRRRRWVQAKGAPSGPSALSGLCVCAECGGGMAYQVAVRGARTYRYLRCSRPTCRRRNCSAGPIERQLHALLGPHIEQLIAAQVRQRQLQAPPPEATAWMRELQAREAIPAEFRQASDQTRIAELQGLIAAASCSATADPTQLLSLRAQALDAVGWFDRPEGERNTALRLVVRSVCVDGGARQITVVDWADGSRWQAPDTN